MLSPQIFTFARVEFPDDKINVLETDQHLHVEQDGLVTTQVASF